MSCQLNLLITLLCFVTLLIDCRDPYSNLYSVIVDEESGNKTCLTSLPDFSMIVRDKKQCAIYCQWTEDCSAFNFKPANKTCDLFTTDSFDSDTISGCNSYKIVEFQADETVNFSSCAKTDGINLARGKEVSVSTPHPTWLAKTLTDGKTTYVYPYCGCSRDLVNGPNWFLIDLVGIFKLTYVLIYNRVDGYTHRLSYAYVGALAVYNRTFGIQRKAYPLCNQFKYISTGIRRLHFQCAEELPPSRYVIVQQAASPQYTYDGDFNLCEVMVYGNCVCSNETFELFWRRCYSPLYYQYPQNKATTVNSNLAVGRPIYSNYDSDDVTLVVDGTWLTCLLVEVPTALPTQLIIDLINIYYVERVVVWNYKDISSAELSYALVGVMKEYSINSQITNTSFELCYKIGNSVNIKKINSTCLTIISGQFVALLQDMMYNYLSLCEIEVYGTIMSPVNIALKKPVRSSSQYGAMAASFIVDGDISALTAAHCAATADLGYGPNWYWIDLKAIYQLKSVTFWNRDDGGSSRLSYVIVGVTNFYVATVSRNTYPLCAKYSKTTTSVITFNVNCSIFTPPARYVIIQQPSPPYTDGYLNFCEFMAYGDYICLNNTNTSQCYCPLFTGYPSFTTRAVDNLALGRPAFMSSGNFSCRLVDGNTNRNHPASMTCVTTNQKLTSDHWIVIDLLKIFLIDIVYITNMDITTGIPGPFLTNITVSVMNYFSENMNFNQFNQTNCGRYTGNSTKISRISVSCSAASLFGKYVMLSRPVNYLSLCEVEVIGRALPN